MIFIITFTLSEAILAKHHALQLATDSSKSLPLLLAHHAAVKESIPQLVHCTELEIYSTFHKASHLVCPMIPSKLRTNPFTLMSHEGFDVRYFLQNTQICTNPVHGVSSSSSYTPKSKSECLFETISSSTAVRENIKVKSLAIDSSADMKEVIVFSPGEIEVERIDIVGGTVLIAAGGDVKIKQIGRLSSNARFSIISLKGSIAIKENLSRSGVFLLARSDILSPGAQRLIGVIPEYPVLPSYQRRRLLGWTNSG